MDIDKYKIPAYQRSKSIKAKARKKILMTALDRKEAGVSIVKPKRKRALAKARTTRRVSYTLSLRAPEVMPAPIINEGPAVMEMPMFTDVREMTICGKCEGYYEKIDVAVLTLTKSLSLGDRVIFETADGLFEQTLEEMQINRKNLVDAFAGDDIGIKVKCAPLKNGRVYKVLN